MSSYNSNLHKMRDKYRQEIRRQYIETYTKNKRKQLIEEYKSQLNTKQQTERQKDYETYFSSLNIQTFRQEPNNHLQFLVEILSSSNSKIFRNRLCDMLTIVHGYLIERFSEQRGKVEYLRRIIKDNKLIDDDMLLIDFVVDILVYNEVFFEPLYAAKQHKFRQQNQIKDNNQLQQSNKEILEKVNSKKLNLYMILDFLMGMMYEITPQIFVASMRDKNINHIKSMNNGYDQLLDNHNQNNIFSNIPNHTVHQNQTNNQSPQILQLINIFNDIYNMTFTLFKITLHSKYQIGTLQKLSNHLYKIYNSSYNLIQNIGNQNQLIINQEKVILNKLNLPELWFDNERMFIKQSVKKNISTRCLHIIVNMTALITMNPQLDSFIHRLMILTEIDNLVSQNGFTQQQIALFINLYSNLVEEQITWTHQYNGFKNQQLYKNRSLMSQTEEQVNNLHILQQPPGIYANLLQVISENAETQQELEHLVYILRVILENYQIPQRQENLRMRTDLQYLNAQNTQLILDRYYAEALAEIISSLFFKLIQKEAQIGQLSNLYIQVIDKMLSYMLYVHQLPEILQLVIKNQNKRIFHIQSKSHSSLSSILSETQEKQKSIITQNLKKILTKTKEFIVIFSEEVLQNPSKIQQINLNYSHETIPKDIIKSIMVLWQQNQIEYCYSEFLEFIHTAVQYFPQHLILTDDNQRNEHFLDLLDQIPSDSSHLNHTQIFIEILEFTLHYIQNYESNLQIQRKNSVSKYIINFKDKWTDILQHLQGLLYSQNAYQKQNQTYSHHSNQLPNPKFHEKVQNLYETIDNMLKSALQNMEIQI